MTKCWIAGDWHGNALWAQSVVLEARKAGVKKIFHVGDFGLWPGPNGEAYMDWVDDACKNDIEIWVTPGNHENWSVIDDTEGEVQWFRNGIAFLPRGYVWEFGGLNWMSMGGAPSIDFEHRREGSSWWPEEMIQDEHVERVKRAVEGLDEGVDILLAHDSPNDCSDAVRFILDNPAGWSGVGLNYAAQGRYMMDQVVEAANPDFLFHGHYHTAGYTETDKGLRVFSLNLDGHTKNVVEFDTETQESEWVSY